MLVIRALLGAQGATWSEGAVLVLRYSGKQSGCCCWCWSECCLGAGLRVSAGSACVAILVKVPCWALVKKLRVGCRTPPVLMVSASLFVAVLSS